MRTQSRTLFPLVFDYPYILSVKVIEFYVILTMLQYVILSLHWRENQWRGLWLSTWARMMEDDENISWRSKWRCSCQDSGLIERMTITNDEGDDDENSAFHAKRVPFKHRNRAITGNFITICFGSSTYIYSRWTFSSQNEMNSEMRSQKSRDLLQPISFRAQ